MTGVSAMVLDIRSPFYWQQEFNMASSRVVLFAFAVLIFDDQALVSAQQETESQVRGDGPIDPENISFLRRCMRALADDVQALRRSLKDTRRSQWQAGMGQMQEGQMHLQILGSDDECSRYPPEISHQPQSPGHPAQIYSNPPPASRPVHHQQAPGLAPASPPAPYPHSAPQQSYPVQGGISYDPRNPHGYLPAQSAGKPAQSIAMHSGFGDSSNMAVQLDAIRRLLNANAAGSR